MQSKANWQTRRFLQACASGMLLAAALSACSTSRAPIGSVAESNAMIVDGYRVGAGDKVKVTVFDEPALSGEYEIGDGGTLALPLIGQIQAIGQTPRQLSEIVSADLRNGGYVLEPRVSIEVLEYRPFFILGEVNEPGEYPYSGDLTLQQAVAKAGGFTPRANKGTVELQRQQWAEPQRLRLDDATLLIAPGDTITILEAFF